MKSANAIKLDRKSGGEKPRDLQFSPLARLPKKHADTNDLLYLSV
jgi:hypothetical protein